MGSKKCYVFEDVQQLNKWKVRAIAFNLAYIILLEVNSSRFYVFVK